MSESPPGDWYEGLQEFAPSNRRALHALLAVLPEMPCSCLDLGCGDGTTVEIMSRLLGINQVLGVDLYKTSPLVHAADLHHSLELGRRFDLVTCWEVAEHIEPESADILSDTIARHVGRWLVLTAAVPKQIGYQHVNCQPPEYWRKKLTARGLSYSRDLTRMLKTVWGTGTAGACVWLTANVQVFEREP